MINESRLFELFENLCKINAPPLREADSVEWTKNYLLNIPGVSVWEDDASSKIGGNANNLIAKLPANVQGMPSIFFSAHFDTVEPTEGLEIEIRDDVYYSKSDTILGADDKGGMAPAIEALHSVQEQKIPHGDLFLVLTCAEEIGLKGAFACDIASLGCSFGYVLDTGPPVGSFVNRVGSQNKIYAKIIGKPAHAGKDPEHGINAIQAASAGIAQMKLGRIDEHTTANVGIMQAGTATNVVPAQAVISMEARSLDMRKMQQQTQHMIDCLEKSARQYGAQCEVQVERMYEGYDIPETEPVVAIALNAAKKLGWEYPLRWTLGGSDANAFNANGVRTIVCGTGMKEIHTHNEHISKQDLVGLTQLVIEIIKQTAQAKS